MVQFIRKFYTNHIYALTWHIKHAKKKYGVDPMEEIMRDGMKYGIETMLIIHGAMDFMVRFLFMQSCIMNNINVDILTKIYFYFCRGKRPKRQNVKIKRINKTLP